MPGMLKSPDIIAYNFKSLKFSFDIGILSCSETSIGGF